MALKNRAKTLIGMMMPVQFRKSIRNVIDDVEDKILEFFQRQVYRKRERKRAHYNHIYYPNDRDGKKWFSRVMFESEVDSSGYVAQYYKRRWNLLHKDVNEDYPAAEILYAKKHKDSAVMDISESSLLPIAIKSKDGNSEKISDEFHYLMNDKEIQLTEIFEERYYYLDIPEPSRVKLKYEEGEFFVGKPVYKKRNQDLRLVLPIFVDGLSSEFFEFESFQRLMPRTYEFFSKGTQFHNCHATSEWTLPSVASICSGLYTQHHGLFHPHTGKVLSKNYSLLSEYFQVEGYFSSQIGGNWRKTPAHGYVRGYDRTLFQREMDVAEDTMEFLDQLQGLPDPSHFAWLTILELHHRFFGAPTIDIQSDHDLAWYYSEPSGKKSVRIEYDEHAIHRNLLEIKKIDRYLGFIYDHIEKSYEDEEILVAFFSDHGQSYLSDDPHVLSDKRIRVPLMFRGKGVSQIVTDEYVQNTDILPSIHHLSGLKKPLENIDGRLPKALGGENEREYVFAESLFPGQTYKCLFKGNEGKFVFDSSEVVNDNGAFDPNSIQCKVKPDKGKVSGKDEMHFKNLLIHYLDTSCLRNRSGL